MDNQPIFDFLGELKLNNHRDWFMANKPRYERLRAGFIADVQQLIDRIGRFDIEIAPLDARSCVYRIYRDVRFSADKTPYKTHFGAFLAGRGGRTGAYAGYYIHLEPGNALLAGGCWNPSAPMLKRLRQDVYDNSDEFLEIIDNPAFRRAFPAFEGETLKRVPAGFPADWPHAELLKRKDYTVVSTRPDSFFLAPDWLEQTVADFELLYPFNRFLNYTIADFIGG